MLQRALLGVMRKVENRRKRLHTNTVNLSDPVPSLNVNLVPCPRKVYVKGAMSAGEHAL